MAPTEPLFTVREVAEALRLHPNTVYEYARQGRIGSVSIGRKRLFRAQDIQAFIESSARPADAPEQTTVPNRPARNPHRRYKT